MEKILISGTGRCGTTFLIKLFTFLGYDTGYTRQNYSNSIFKNCNSGMEKDFKAPNYIIKNPNFMINIKNIVQNVKIQYMIIPIRKYEQSAESRVKNKNSPGGLWNAKSLQEQIKFFHKLMADYLEVMVKHDIPTIFLDFGKID